MPAHRVPEAARKYVDAFSSRDPVGCAEAFAADGTYSDPGTPQPVSRDAFREQFHGFFAAFPDATTETLALEALSETVSLWRWVIRGTNAGPWRGMPPTGRRFELPGCEFIEVREGLIYRIEGYYDRLTLLTQLGFAPDPQAPPA